MTDTPSNGKTLWQLLVGLAGVTLTLLAYLNVNYLTIREHEAFKTAIEREVENLRQSQRIQDQTLDARVATLKADLNKRIDELRIEHAKLLQDKVDREEIRAIVGERNKLIDLTNQRVDKLYNQIEELRKFQHDSALKNNK